MTEPRDTMDKTLLLPRRRAAAALLGLALCASGAPAQPGGAFPGKPLTWIVGFPPGGSVDTATRLVARRLEAVLGQTIVVDNRPGASGLMALQATLKAPADGYTLVTVPGPIVTAKPLPQIGKELAAVALLGSGPAVLVATAATPMPATVKDLIAGAKARPDRYSYVSSGNGTAQHLAGELLNHSAGTAITHIPYKGGTQAVTDVVGGQVPLGMLGITAVLPHIMSGKLKAYAVTTRQRARSLPDVPTLAEAGVPGFEAMQWFAVAVAAGTPAERVQKLNAAIAGVLQQPEVVAGFAKVGMDIETATPSQATAFVVDDLRRWHALAQKAHLQLD